MKQDVATRLAALQADMQQTQAALAALEQERQGLLQRLLQLQGGAAVLHDVLAALEETPAPCAPAPACEAP